MPMMAMINETDERRAFDREVLIARLVPQPMTDPSGEPVIREARVPVRAIVEMWRLGVRPEEIPDHLPHIGLAQVDDLSHLPR